MKRSTNPLQHVQVSREPIYRQISTQVRALIRNGDVAVGEKLPPIRDLAEQWNAKYATVRSALKELALEGLLEQSPKRGTVVLRRSAALQSVGIYFGGDIWRKKGMAYYFELYRKLCDELSLRGVKYQLWADARDHEDQGKPLPELLTAVTKREIQGVIIGLVDTPEFAWLQKLNVPLAINSNPAVPWKVTMDRGAMMDLALGELKRLGCRSVGAIFPLSVSTDAGQFYQNFTDRIAGMCLETRNSWVCTPDRELGNMDHENFGYQQFQKIWSQAERPDGLLIYPDTLVRGAITAMLQEGVSVPRDLKLVMHRNEGIPVLCPYPASWLVTDTSLLANALIRQIDRQLEGEPVEPIFVSEKLECQ